MVHALFDKKLLKAGQLVEVALRGARHHIEHDVRVFHQHIERLAHSLETEFISPHPVVVFLQSVETHGEGMHTGRHKFFVTLRGKIEAIGDDAPGKTLVIDFTAPIFQIVAYQRLTTCNHDKDSVGIETCRHAVEHAQKVLARHVGGLRHGAAVAAAVPAVEVAPQCTLPKELGERMVLHKSLVELVLQLHA